MDQNSRHQAFHPFLGPVCLWSADRGPVVCRSDTAGGQ